MSKETYITPTNLNTLEVGTRFYVINGAWDGEIVEHASGKAVKNQLGVFPLSEADDVHNKRQLQIVILENSTSVMSGDDLPF